MTIQKIKHSETTLWEGNPRPVASVAERAEMKASLATKGQIMPMIGRKTPNGIEIIAGRNRHINIGELIAEGAWDADKDIMVDVFTKMDDATALDIATSENINIPMHPMHQFETFEKLIDMGRKVEEIANSYGVTPRVVEQRLSYAKLAEGARKLVKDNLRDLDWASAMTVASREEQQQILDEIDADARRYRNSHDVRGRLQNELVSLKYALFDVEKVNADIVRRDLFDADDAKYMVQSDFIPLQDKAVQELVEERKAEGWSEVQVKHHKDFDAYRYNNGITDKEKAITVFVRYDTGEVVEHAGLALRHEERINNIEQHDESAADSIFGDDDSASDDIRAMIADEEEGDRYVEGRKTKIHLENERAAIIQKMILQNSKAAMAVTVAGLIGLDAARPLEGKVYTGLNNLDEKGVARTVIEEKISNTYDIMKAGKIDPSAKYEDLLAALMKLEEKELMFIYQTELARRITPNLTRVEKLYETLIEETGTSVSDHWSIDREFIGTLSVSSMRGLAEEILPNRLVSKIGRAKNDVIETIAQIVDDTNEGGVRMGVDEQENLRNWIPDLLRTKADTSDNPFALDQHGDQDNDPSTATNENDQPEDQVEEGAAIFA